MSIIEPYHPDRVVRQFGLRQSIPSMPIGPFKGRRGLTGQQYTVMFRFIAAHWDGYANHVLAHASRVPVQPGVPHDCSKDYLPWVRRLLHLRVENPINRQGYEEDIAPSTEDRVANAADIAETALRAQHMGPWGYRQALENVLRALGREPPAPAQVGPYRTYERRGHQS